MNLKIILKLVPHIPGANKLSYHNSFEDAAPFDSICGCHDPQNSYRDLTTSYFTMIVYPVTAVGWHALFRINIFEEKCHGATGNI